MQRTLIDYMIITLKGLAMGAADVVPGVSGGTIAFISGIYEELIDSINKVNPTALKLLKNEGISAAWRYVNGNFLIALLTGIAISVLSLAKVLKWLLEHHPVLLWSFFFGLVLASVILVARQIKKWRLITVLGFILGAVVAWYITTLPPMQDTSNTMFLLLAGALAICAMILPGISGAFILVLLGAYETVLEAVNEKDLKTIAIIGIGAIFGLLSFSRLLKYLFNHYKNATLAVLTGFIFGSLNKIWPWKEVVSSRTIGEKTITIERSISPFSFDGNPQLVWALLLAAGGFLSIYILERMAIKNS
ncbi:DUF368 domain-containing protein [Robertkochia marina]|uniref:DUF368 domain-containing protein n=1 Tax=Robertkochia marina TaxID=1227945 RepID=A0A4S3LY99_9FLAO|nr:DUF368 domain-containing protein [Robertkochia marina]THD66559.1 DUF368 domain-containing protein [Robertkochia marina]TRZ45602.1 DUF368 domain-containing protein [Robertkochia marina]